MFCESKGSGMDVSPMAVALKSIGEKGGNKTIHYSRVLQRVKSWVFNITYCFPLMNGR